MVKILEENLNGKWYCWTGEELMESDFVACQEADLPNWKQFKTRQEALDFYGIK